MLGIDDKKKPKRELYKFDLEKELLTDVDKLNEEIEKVKQQKQELKNLLRTGLDKESFEEGGVILQGLDALEIVFTRLKEKK